MMMSSTCVREVVFLSELERNEKLRFSYQYAFEEGAAQCGAFPDAKTLNGPSAGLLK
jgi:hypothetical protein